MDRAAQHICDVTQKLDALSTDAPKFILGDFNQCKIENCLPTYHQCITCPARMNKTIRDSVSTTVCKSLIHGLVTSRVDYGNAILFGISDRHLHRLEMVQRSAARIVMQIRRGDRQSMTTILRQLHWLPVRKRIEYKLHFLLNNVK